MQPYDASASGNDNVRRYGLAIMAAAIALALRQLVAPFLGENNPYHTLWAAVVFSAWYCGLGPSIVATVIGLCGVWYWFLPPSHSFSLQDPTSQASGMIGFLVFAGLIIALGETNRRSVVKNKLAEEELQRAHDELEKKVEERTADLNKANESLRELSGRLQQMQDEERRQIARELHDSVGQLLAAIAMNISVVHAQSHKLDTAGARAVSENSQLLDEINREIRTISHLLHPPMLDIAGLATALRWYVDGFSERSKIKVSLDVQPDFPRLPEEMEIAVFRIIQECLTNIHRHSGSPAAVIQLHQKDQRVLVEVRDSGRGIALEKQLELSSTGRTGVGFRGMRERLRRLGGQLDIESDGKGTVVTASFPFTQDVSAPTPQKHN